MEREQPDVVVAVDGALAFFDKVEAKTAKRIRIDHLVGDFDTISPEVLNKFKDDSQTEIHRFVPEKDNTDTDIAVDIALQLAGEDEAQIMIIGALGGRTDHMLANLQMLEVIAGRGKEGVILDETNRIRLISGHLFLKRDQQYGKYISLVPVSRHLRGLTLRGVKYPLENKDVIRGRSLLISNEITSDTAEILLGEGLAYLIESRDREGKEENE
jgi:thiamine pyrophosphokinase